MDLIPVDLGGVCFRLDVKVTARDLNVLSCDCIPLVSAAQAQTFDVILR